MELSQIGVFEKMRSEEKWREALVELGQKKEKEGGQEEVDRYMTLRGDTLML